MTIMNMQTETWKNWTEVEYINEVAIQQKR